jgi:PAS domain S-box-containing protein
MKPIEHELIHLTEELEWSNKMMNYIGELSAKFITIQDPFVLYSNYLDNLLEMTKSEFGLIGDVLYDEKGNAYLKLYALSNLSWNTETKALYEDHKQNGFEFRNLNTLFGMPVKTGKHIISNDPMRDIRGAGFPQGHPELKSFFGAPVFNGEKLVGVVGLANRKDGYSEDMMQRLSPALNALGHIIEARWEKEKRLTAEKELDEVTRDLALQKYALDQAAIVSSADVSGKILYVNDKFCDLSGYSREELIGKNHRVIKSDEHSPQFFEEMWQTISLGKTWHGEVKNKSKDGSDYWLEATIVPFLNSQGKPYKYISIRTDITHQKQLQLKLQESDTRFRKLFEHIPVVYLSLTENGVIKDVNHMWVELLGYTRNEVAGKKFCDFESDDTNQECIDSSVKFTTQGIQAHHKLFLKHKNGSVVPVLLTGQNQYDTGGQFVCTHCIIVDISELEKAEKKLIAALDVAEKATQAKSDFLANMSHEIRTPMSIMIGFTEQLAEEEKDPERKRLFEIIRRSEETLLGIINNVLDLSKIESGKFPIEKKVQYTDIFFQEIESLFSVHSREKKIDFTVNIADNMPESLIMDGLRIKQVLYNLLGNAMKFTDHRGKVTLDAYYDMQKSKIGFSIEDNGIGIAPEKLKTVFQAFEQESVLTQSSFGGTGLGLSIASKLVKLMEGELKVESTQGQGSRFFFEIPAYFAVPLNNTEDETIKAENKAVSFKGHILVAEDQDSIAMLLGMMLKKFGLTYTRVDDGLKVVEAYQNEAFDLVFMDINMPLMDGMEATKEIRRIEEEKSSKHTPVISVSANVFAKDQERFIDAGMDYNISKPYTMENIKEALTRYLS